MGNKRSNLKNIFLFFFIIVLGAIFHVKYIVVQSQDNITFKTEKDVVLLGEIQRIRGSIDSMETVNLNVIYKGPNNVIINNTVITDTNGTFQDIFTPNCQGLWTVEVQWNKNGTYQISSVSLKFVVKYQSTIICYTKDDNVILGDAVIIVVRLMPNISNTNITLIFNHEKEEQQNISRSITNSTYSHKFRLNSTGKWKLYAVWPGDEKYCASESEILMITVRKNNLFLQYGISSIASIFIVTLLLIINKRKNKILTKTMITKMRAPILVNKRKKLLPSFIIFPEIKTRDQVLYQEISTIFESRPSSYNCGILLCESSEIAPIEKIYDEILQDLLKKNNTMNSTKLIEKILNYYNDIQENKVIKNKNRIGLGLFLYDGAYLYLSATSNLRIFIIKNNVIRDLSNNIANKITLLNEEYALICSKEFYQKDLKKMVMNVFIKTQDPSVIRATLLNQFETLKSKYPILSLIFITLY